MAKKAQAPQHDAILQQVVNATQNDPGYLFLEKEKFQHLLTDDPLVEYMETFTNPDDPSQFGVRATTKGIETVTQTAPPSNATAQTQPAPAVARYVIEDGVNIPDRKRMGGGRTNTYPFEQLDVNQSFFVAGEDKAKSMSSTVSAANARYATEAKNPDGTPKMREGVKRQRQPDGTTKTWKEQVPAYDYQRYFISRHVTENGVIGVRVWRQS